MVDNKELADIFTTNWSGRGSANGFCSRFGCSSFMVASEFEAVLMKCVDPAKPRHGGLERSLKLGKLLPLCTSVEIGNRSLPANTRKKGVLASRN